MGEDWLILEGSMMIDEFDERFHGKKVLFCPLGWGGSQEMFKFRKILQESSLTYAIRPLYQHDFTREIMTGPEDLFEVNTERDPDGVGPGWAEVLVIYDDGVTSSRSLMAGYEWGVENREYFGAGEVYTMVREDNVGISHFSGIKNFRHFSAPSDAGEHVPKDVKIAEALEEKLDTAVPRDFIFSVGPRTRGWLPFAFCGKERKISVISCEEEADNYARLLSLYLQEFGYDAEAVVHSERPTGEYPIIITADYDRVIYSKLPLDEKGIYIHAGIVRPNVFNTSSEDRSAVDRLTRTYMHTVADLVTGRLHEKLTPEDKKILEFHKLLAKLSDILYKTD